MRKFIKILSTAIMLLTGLSLFSVNQALAYCDASNLSTGKSAVATSTVNDIELATMLSLTSSHSTTNSSNFSGFKLTCVTGGEMLYYRNGLEGGYTVKFVTGDQETYIRFTASIPASSKEFGAFITQDYASSEFDTDITINAEVVDGTAYDIATTTGKIEIPVLYFISSNGSNAYPTASALRGLVSSKAAAATSSYSDLKGFASFDVTFVPVSTTCNIQNQQFSLPSTTLFTIKSGDASDTRFTIPLSCSGSINSKATKTFNLRAYSNDLVDNAKFIVRNASSTSTGIGFQLFNDIADPLKFSSGYDSASTSLASLTKNKDLVGSLTSFDIGARYKIYDAANATPGTVVGTIIIYMEYE
ncbi:MULTISPECIES: fimbrial protein [Pantoea]|uniref:fimbrial protein n=1 Tax=Pantoea TaxID=53335 RepID=UPI001F271B32|nr:MULTISPECIES: fimbrial protein [Pantoea]UIL53515.1 fimbrial protein [Pantoea agglomerans]